MMTNDTSVLKWSGPGFVSKRAELEVAYTGENVSFVPSTIYWQRQILIEALEGFLKNFGGFRV